MRSVNDCDMLNAHVHPVSAKISHRQRMKIHMVNSVEHLFEIGTRIAHTKVGHVHSFVLRMQAHQRDSGFR